MIHHSGRIEVICGSMFCGKTEELIRRVRRATIARQTVQVFKPIIDHRFGVERVTSHDGQKLEAQPIATPGEIPALLSEETTVVAIDEVQFFDNSVIPVVEALASKGIRVICAGTRPRFSRRAVRSDAAATRSRRRSHQTARDLHRLRRGCQPYSAARQR